MANTDSSYRIERPDRTQPIIKIVTGRLKDSEAPEPIYLMGKVIDLGSVDADGRAESSLVLVPTHARPMGSKRPAGKRIDGVIQDAKIMIKSWRQHYNEVRPHSSLGMLTPAEFKKTLTQPNPM